MKEKNFLKALIITIILGVISTAALFAYSFSLKKSVSLTAFIATEKF
ncbi:MAG: hypothetical protein J6X37_03880 [Treponema sp.]|nr:hypothetical protein [Treponema sp.]MBP5587847.1 hypothetical protein [Treponema sp.]MCR5387046.1 hypothetical protein [Treponema sp.]